MARFSVKYTTINRLTKASMGTMGTTVNASSIAEAKQQFKYHHPDTASTSYKIIAVIKTP